MSTLEPLKKSTADAKSNAESGCPGNGALPARALPKPDAADLTFQLQAKEMELEVREQQLQATQALLQEANARYEDLYNSIPVGFVTLGQRGHIVEVNLAGAQLLRQPRYELLGRHFADFLHPSQEVVLTSHLYELLNDASGSKCREYTLLDEGGDEERRVRCDVTSRFTHEGQVYWHLAIVDITELKRVESALLQSEAFLRAVFASIKEAVVVIDTEFAIRKVNPTAQHWFRDGENPVGRKCYAVFCGKDSVCAECPAVSALTTGSTGTVVKPGPESSRVGWMEVFAYPIDAARDRSPTGVVVFARDITKRKQLETELEQRATHDALTGAYNRLYAEGQIEKAMVNVRERGQPAVIALVDIDRFKRINDTYGHLAGDLVLKQLVIRIASRIRGGDVLARWGGEEFLLLLPSTDLPGGLTLLESVRQDVKTVPFSQVGEVTISTGVAQYVVDEMLDDWIRRADEALYAAKAAGRDRVIAAVTGTT